MVILDSELSKLTLSPGALHFYIGALLAFLRVTEYIHVFSCQAWCWLCGHTHE